MVLASTIASQTVGLILIGVFGGKWIDSKLETEPLFLIVGLLSGIVLGVFGMMRLLKNTIQGD